MSDVDGRQTRPADDVGRPDGSSIGTSFDGGAKECITRASAAYKAGKQKLAIGWLCAAIEAIADEDETIPELKRKARTRQIRERQRSREASYGEAPPDAEA